MLPQLTKVLKKDLKSFLIKSFYTLNPNTKYIDNWHIDLILEYLKGVNSGQIKRLIINVPPRSLKSLCISAVWPAWILGQNTAARIIAASYSNALSIKHSQDSRKIISSTWYQKTFPETKLIHGQNEKSKFVTTNGGFRFSTSIGGTLTGEGADILIVDDPHTPIQAMSSVQRNRAIEWFEQTFATRLNDKKRGAIILVMQRLHKDDLTGYLLEKNTWTHLNLPAINEVPRYINFGNISRHLKANELLNPAREGEKEIEVAKQELGSYAFNAQYQQNPIAKSAMYIKYEWIKRYKTCPASETLYQSWDCAAKIGTNNDYSVCTTWTVINNQYYLINVYRDKLEFPDLRHKVLQMYEKYKPAAVLVEDKVSGHALIQEINHTSEIPIIKITPSTDKETRFLTISGMFEAGKINFPQNSPWLAQFEDEIMNFPNTKHDDQVDSMTQFLQWSRKKNSHSPQLHLL